MRKSIWYAGIVLFYSLSFAVEPPTICQLGINSTPNTISLWHMNEGVGTTVYDNSLNHNSGAFAGDPVWTTGKFGNGLDLDAEDDYINCGSPPSLEFGEDDAFSVFVWVNLNSAPDTNQIMVSKFNDSSGYFSWQVWKGGAGLGVLIIDIFKEDVTGWSLDIPSAITPGEWQHIGFTYDGLTGAAYMNAVSGDPSNRPYSDSTKDTETNFEIGFASDKHPTGRCLNGIVDEVAVWERALSAGEVENIYYRNPKSQ